MPPRPLRRALLLLLLAPLAACGGGDSTCAATANFAPGVDHGPAVALPSPTGMSITWASVATVTGAVEYGPTSGYGSTIADAAPGQVHELRITGLAPGSVWHYRLLHDGQPAGGDHVFRTPVADRSSAPFRFAVVGDGGTGCGEEFTVLGRIAAMAPDFVLATGDLAYDAGSAGDVRNGFLIPFASLLETVPVFVTWGNHDVKTFGGLPLADALVLPANDEEGTEYYASFDWGNLHAITLDSNRAFGPGSPQRTWLERDLTSPAAASATWTVVFFHHPAYSSSSHGSTASVDAELVPLFDAHGVDLVFNGHDHDYERTHPMLGGAPTSTTGGPAYLDPAGTIYVVTGGGGKDLYPAGTSPFTAVSVSAFHALQVDVDGASLSVTAVRDDGVVLDAFSITKSP